MKILYRKASALWVYKVIDVSLDDLLQMSHEGRGIILSLNENKGTREKYKDEDVAPFWFHDIMIDNDLETINHIFNDKYVITQYDDWME